MTKQFKAKRSHLPPLDFEIQYERLIDGAWEEQTEKFQAQPMIPGGLMLELAAAMDKPIGVQSTELIRLLDAAIMDDDKQGFHALINDPKSAIPLETLGEILEWLAEEYAERPTPSA